MTQRLTDITVEDYSKPKKIDLISGSPRELSAHIDQEEDFKPTKGAKVNATINIAVQLFTNYAYLIKLVPQNCFVTSREDDMIPGLGSGIKSLMNMPKPYFEEKVDKQRKSKSYKCTTELSA